MALTVMKAIAASAVVAAAVGLASEGALAGANFVANPGFELSSDPLSTVTYGGMTSDTNPWVWSPATDWGVWNNSNGTTTVSLVSPSADTIVAGGAYMIGVATSGNNNGLFQFFDPNIAHDFAVDVLVTRGRVQLGSAYGGGDWAVASVNAEPYWQHIAFSTPKNQDEIFIYSASTDGATFYADNAYAAAPEPATWAMMLAGFAGLAIAGYRASRKTASVAA